MTKNFEMPSKEALSRLLKDLYRDEEQIKGIIQASPLAVAIFDSRGMCVFLNRSCMELFGIKDMKSLRHRNLLDPAVISGKTKEKLLRGEAIEIEAVLDPSKAQELGLPKARKGGLRLKVLMNAIMRGKEKKPEGFIVRMAGLTERKGRGEEFEMIVEGSTIPMFVLGKDHKVSHWNKAMEALTGLRKGEIIGTDDQWRLFYPSKRPILADLLIDRARDEEIAKLYKNKYRRSSLIKGAYEGLDYFPLFGENGRWIHFSASPLKDAEGGIIGAIETAQDVTETKQYEKQIKALKEFSENIVESAPIGIIVVDLGKKVTACNKAHGDIYWMDKEKALGRVICRDCMKELGGVIEPLLEKAITAGKTSQLRGLDYSAQGVGRTQTLDILISPLVTDNEITGAVMITKDVTERRLLKERVRVLEKKDLPLTEKDKTVLYGLVRYPEYNDIELAKKLRIKRSTLTSIKNKLSRAGFYTTLRIPNLPVLGYELVSISYGNFVLSNDKEEKDVFKKELAYPEYVSIQSTGLEYYAMMVSKNITKYKEKTDPLETEYDRRRLVKYSSTIHFPFNLSSIRCVCDYSMPLYNWFRLKIGDAPRKPMWNVSSRRKLSDNEGKVLYALTKYPTLSDKDVSEKVGLNKITVGQIKKRLMEEGFIQTVRIPDLKKLGCELILLLHMRFNPDASPQERLDLMSEELPEATTCIADMREAISVIPFKDFTEYKTVFDRFMQKNKNKLFIEDPKTLLIPVNMIRMQKLDFAPLLKTALGLEREY